MGDPEEVMQENLSKIERQMIQKLNEKESVLQVVRSIKKYPVWKKKILFRSEMNHQMGDNLLVGLSRIKSTIRYSEEGIV